MKNCCLSSPDFQQPRSTAAESSAGVNPTEGPSQLGWEDQGSSSGQDLQDTCEDTAPLLLDRLHSLADAERLFDELTQEKLQVRIM